MRIVIFVAVIAILAACSVQNDAINTISGYDTPIELNGSEMPYSEIDIVVLDSLLEMPRKLVATEQYNFVQTKKQVLCYDKKGHLLNRIGQEGHGANEYINLATFYLDANDMLVIVDSYKGKLLKYTYDGKFMECMSIRDEILADVQNACMINEDSLWLNNYIFNKKNNIYDILAIKSGDITHAVSVALQSNSTKEPIGFHPYSYYKNRLIYIKPFDDRIYDKEGNVLYQILTNRKVFSDKKLKEINDYNIMTYVNALNKGCFAGFTDLFETDRYILAACKNFDYIFLDKQKLSCSHQSYAIEQNLEYFPLLNIMASSDNKLLGIIDTNILSRVKKYNQKNLN